MNHQTKDFHRSLFHIFLSYFPAHKKLFLLDMSCAFLVGAIDVAFPLVSRYVMYDLLPDKLYRTFFSVMAIVVAAFVLRAGMNFIITYWGHQFGIRVEADIRRDLYVHFQELDFDFFDRNRTGKLMNRLTGDLFAPRPRRSSDFNDYHHWRADRHVLRGMASGARGAGHRSGLCVHRYFLPQ